MTAPRSADRARLMRRVHGAARELAMSDEDRHALQERVTGKASLTKMSETEIREVAATLETMRDDARRRAAGSGPDEAARPRDRLPDSPQTPKLRALWISAYNLGVAEDPTDGACAAFLRRQLNLDAAAWAGDPKDIGRAIEALKLWLARPFEKGGGGVDWSPYEATNLQTRKVRTYENPRARVVEAQWKILHRLGAVEIEDPGARDNYASRFAKVGLRGIDDLSDEVLDRLIRHFGKWIRAAKLVEEEERP